MEVEYFLLIQNLSLVSLNRVSTLMRNSSKKLTINIIHQQNSIIHLMNKAQKKQQNLYMHLNISSLSYYHLELYNLVLDMKIKPKIIGISESRLQKSKQNTTNISLPNYVYEHTPTESSKGGTLLYLDKNLKYKIRKDLNIYHKGMTESTFVEIIN